ncbi:hypothetical protein HJC23_004263 [Cyclotella cryptica]|uniref:RAP domain-containing protein n=1 Tax=Cyclotella cryptica TaxID=29204 RepID=A0ABD3PH16_9STRA|eukprot:CCRYP_014650-RA/>CCRYP_014650-RA protein AED:0.06 eAED:0.05 QI:0/-1/0/1/-1/1/1/0/778
MSCLGRTARWKALDTVRPRDNLASLIGLPTSPVRRDVSRPAHCSLFSLVDRVAFRWSSRRTASQSIGHDPSMLIPPHIAFRSYTPQSKRKFLNVADCKTAQELLQAATDNLEELPLAAVAAVWSRIPRLLSQRPAGPYDDLANEQTHESHAARCELEVFSIVENTMNSLHSSRPRDLTTIILGMAKTAKCVRGSSGKSRLDMAYHRAFRHFLLDGDSNPKEEIFQDLAEAASDILPRFKSRELSNLAYAYALLGYDPKLESDRTLFQQIAMESLDRLHQFNAQDLSNMVWAFAALDVSDPILFRSVGDVVVGLPDLDAFKPQELSSILWAFATANQSHPALFEKVGNTIAALDDWRAFNPQELSNIVWAYATLNESHAGLFEKVGIAIDSLADLKSFTPQTFSNIVWAYATVGRQNPRLFRKIGDAIEDLDDLRLFTPQAFSNILWAYGKANELHNGLFEKVGSSILARNDLHAFTPQELSNIVWALATAKVKNTALFEKIGDALVIRPDMSTFTPQNLSNTVWAYAKSNESHPGLFKRVGDTIVARDDGNMFTPQNIVNTVWAFATANELRPDVFEKIGDAIVQSKDLNSFTARGLANLAWSYAISNVDAPSLFNRDFIDALLTKQDDFFGKNLCQLHQWHLWQTGEMSKSGLPKVLEERCRRAFINYHVTTSALQEDAVEELISMGLNPQEEVLTGSGYRLDALVIVDGKRLGIEVDGPSHFIGKTVNGGTILKHRQVTAIDKIPIVSIAYWEWNKFGNDSSKKQGYLRSLLGASE